MKRNSIHNSIPIAPDPESAADLEIQNHIAEATERLIAEGMSESEARAEAVKRFGSVQAVRSTMVRETRSMERRATLLDFLSSIPADAKYAWRGLMSNKLFTLVVIGTLGLGIGAAATGFTILDALLLRPLPYHEPDRLVDIQVMGEDGSAMPIVSPARAQALIGTPGLTSVAFSDQRGYTITGDQDAETVGALAVSANMDEVLGITPALGRGFDESDMAAGTHRVMLSYDFWRKRGGDKSEIGKSIRLDGVPHEIVGVLPRHFKYPVGGSPRALWVALTNDFVANGRPLPYVSVIARLADDVSVESAVARLAAIPVEMSGGAPARGLGGMKLGAMPTGQWRGNPELKHGVWLLMGAISLMLLVAMVNAMNLILFRGADRTRELAIRLALGVSRAQLLRHILVENVVIAFLSGAAAVLIAVAGVAGVNQRLPEEFAFSSVYTFQVNPRVLAFTFLLAAVIGLILGVLPSIRSLRLKFVSGELTSARGATRGDTRIAQGLVIAEVAIAVTLLAGAGLLANSFSRLTRVETGIDTDHIAMVSVSLPGNRYKTPEEAAAFLNRYEAELEANPAIDGATVSVGAPPGVSFQFGVELQAENGAPLPVPKDDPGLLPFIAAAPDFLETAGMKLAAGRDLNGGDAGTDNVLIDTNLSRALWGADVTGRRFRTGPEDKWLTVVGVYQHVRAMGLDDRTTPYGFIRARNPARAGNYMSVTVHTPGDPAKVLPIMRDVMRKMDRDVPLSQLQTARDAYSETVDKPRFLARVMTGVSAIALTLAAIGVYGVLSYSVTRRRREMGIRMALGAPPMGLGWLFLREGMLMTVSGLAVGLVAGLWLVRFTRSLLYALEPTDPATFAVVSIVVMVVAILASMIPARVAGRMSPAAVLRME